jgi:gliding motility-associated-like protein
MFDSKLLSVKKIFMQRSSFRFSRSLVVLVLTVFAFSSKAQNHYGHNWYFGNSTSGIRFNRIDHSATFVTDKATPFGDIVSTTATGGSATASDPVTGRLIFYSDGLDIYDVTHSKMPNGIGLGGNSFGNQPVAITKVPGQKTQYYVFVNTANGTTPGTVSYRIVDMAEFGNAFFPDPPQGNGVGGNVPVTGLTGRSEAMIVIPHFNGEDFWLITHANGTPDYSVTPITLAGPGAPVTYTGLGFIEVAANFSYHPGSPTTPGTGRLAVSPQEPNRDVEILRFDNTTGTFPPGITQVANTGVLSTGNQTIYDTEFSSSGRYLYISRHGEAAITADLMQYDIQNPLTTIATVLPAPISRSYGLQMAPDSVIYHLYQSTAGGPFLMGAIRSPDSVANDVDYDISAFNSNPNINGMQFAAVPPPDTVLLSVTYTTQGTCANSPVSFFPTVTPAADSLVWDFGDGSGATAWSPVHTYTAAGTYATTVEAFLNGSSASFAVPVTIIDFDLQLTLVQDTTACLCEYKPPVGSSCNGGPFQVTAQAQGGASPQYQWFGPSGLLAGQNTTTLTPDSAGYYYLVGSVTTAGGTCSAYAGVNIKTYDSLDQRANIWYFGQNAGIDFNGLPDDPAVGITGPLITNEGTSVISDRNGQVIFSTDGLRIYNKDDVEITPAPVPPGLGGDPEATQSALIMPVPGDETLFYIFTTQPVHGTGTYELRYSLFDLKLNNGSGGLTQFNQLLFAKSTERITSNGNWLIAHEFGNNSFRAYRIDQQGIGTPVITAIGSDHLLSEEVQGRGYMELGAQNRLAVALSTPGVSNVVEVFDFVDSTGMVTNFRTANLNSATGQVYGIELSPGGNKLYATLSNPAGSQIHEFAIDSLGVITPLAINNQPGELGAMQIGPDGQIYVAINNSATLGTFTANENRLQPTGLPNPLQPFTLAGGTQSKLGLPNFVQTIANPAQSPGLSFTGICLGDSTQFSATGKDSNIDKFDWFFGDGQNVADGGPQIGHVYAAVGTYIASVRIYNKCEEVGTFTQTVVIRSGPVDPSFNPPPLCLTQSIDLDANPPDADDLSYVWSTGDTTEVITVNNRAIFNVTVTDSFGCSTDGSFIVTDARPTPVNFGPDITACQNSPQGPLVASNNPVFTTYAWEINTVPNTNTTQRQTVNTSVPGVFLYKVRATNILNTFGCFIEDSIQYTIIQSPAFTASTLPPAACGLDGQINVNITAPAASLFTYFITGPSGSFSNIDQTVGPIAPVAAAAGTYGVTVSDQVSGCATITTVNINDPAFTVTGAMNASCDPIGLLVSTSVPQGALTYRVINNATAAVAETGNAPSSPFNTAAAGLPSNSQNYVVEVSSAGCTASSTPINVNEAAAVQANLTANACVNPITITATPTTGGTPTFAWTGPAIIGSASSATITADPPQGSQTFLVTITDGVLCPLDTSIVVNVNNDVIADFTQTDPCADQATLTASPIGTYIYNWFRNSASIPGGSSLVVGTIDDNQLYRVAIANSISGCIFQSPEKTVNVEGDLQTTLESTIPCEGAPFTLTAGSNLTPVTFAWTLDASVITGQTSATLTDTREGLYDVTVTRGVCSETLPFNIVLGPVTPGLLTDTGIICPDDANLDPTTKEVVLDPGAGFISYQWFKEGIADPDGTLQLYKATTVGLYSVDMVNAFGCPSSDHIELFEECDPRITGPNAFRPTSGVNEGGDFTNREFRLFTFFIADTDFHIFIFNRWGEMIFESGERDFRWNGGYNNNPGQPLPAGTYSFVVKYKSSYRPEEGIQERRGGVALLR